MTKPFNRGLTDEFVKALNRAYEDQDSWWRKLIDDRDLFLGIRENYIDVYFNGGRILELEYIKGIGLVGRTHFKYLINLTREDEEADYVKFANGKFDAVKISQSFIDITTHITKIKAAAGAHQGTEKAGVHRISVKRDNVIDVEIQFPGSQSRIDFSALRKVGNEIEIVFFESLTRNSIKFCKPLRGAVS